MNPGAETTPTEGSLLLNFFCTREGKAWRVYMRPTWLPRFLDRSFDKHWEAYPVELDFEDLDRYMQKRGVAYDKRESTRGDMEITARGRAASELAVWLSRSLASGVRGPATGDEKNRAQGA